MAETTFVGKKSPRWKNVLFANGVIVVGGFTFLTWFKLYYSMEVAEALHEPIVRSRL